MTGSVHRVYIGSMIVVGIAVVTWAGLYGFSYYTTSVPDRFGHPLHDELSPSGFWGHGMGFIGAFLMTVGVVMYSIRKRVRFFANAGQIKHVLEFHIFLCLVGPALIIYHTAFKLGGLVSVSFWCMIVSAGSGVVGRYLYLQIPKTVTGRDVTYLELEKKITELRRQLVDVFHVAEEVIRQVDLISNSLIESSRTSLVLTLPRLMIQNATHRNRVNAVLHKAEAALEHRLPPEASRALLEKAHLQRQLATLTMVQKLFRHWHMFHLPFAVIMFIIMIAHIVTAFLFGYGWIFVK